MALEQRRYLQKQEVSFDAGYVRLVQRTLISRKRHEWLYLFRELSLTRSKTYRNPHWLWLAAGALFLIAAVVNVLEGEKFLDVAVGALFGMGLVGFWVIRRTAWAGYSPLMIWDLGRRSSRMLDEINRRRLRFLIDEVAAVRDVDAALGAITRMERDGVISTAEADELRTMVSPTRYSPGGYL